MEVKISKTRNIEVNSKLFIKKFLYNLINLLNHSIFIFFDF